MKSNGKLIIEFEDENCIMDLTLLVELTAHLNGSNIHLPGNKQLISIIFQTITTVELKL